MIIKKNIFAILIFTGVIIFALNFSVRSQEIPAEDEDDQQVVDSINYGEDLLDSNEAYRQQFDSLSKDGEWIKANKTDLVRDLTNNTGEDLDFPPQTTEVIYVWRPYGINSYWNPYSNGNWVFSNCGWIWISNYSWGWGPYNYGRWYFSNFYGGWVWFPGRVWAPNWVTWRVNGQYAGWYPLCPKVYWRGHGGRLYTNHHFVYKPHNWIFVNKKNFTKKIDNSTTINRSNNAGILKNSQQTKTALYNDPSISKFKYTGPEVKAVASSTGENISPKKVIDKKSGGKELTDDINNSSPGKTNTFKAKDNSTDGAVKNEQSEKGKNYKEKTEKSNYPPVDRGNNEGKDKTGDKVKKESSTKPVDTGGQNKSGKGINKGNKRDGKRKK